VKLLESIVGIVPKNLTVVKFAHSNAFAPMVVTDAGIVTLVKPAQPENAYAKILFTVFGIVYVDPVLATGYIINDVTALLNMILSIEE